MVLWVILHGPTESNSVEKPLLTFLSIKKYLLPGLVAHIDILKRPMSCKERQPHTLLHSKICFTGN